MCLGMRDNGVKIVRIALTVGYVGHDYFGVQINSAEVEKQRPSIAGVIRGAAQRAWGDVMSTTCGFAVRTEKGASAKQNLLVMHVKRGTQCVLDEAALRRELPPFVAMDGPPRIIPKVEQDAWHAVRKQTYVVMKPY